MARGCKQEEGRMRWITNLTVVPVIVLLVFTIMGRAADLPGVSPETVADYIHVVVQAHRAFYTEDIVERLEEQGGIKADEEWRTHKKTLPLPVQVVTETSGRISTRVTGVRYRLISLWPINPKNSPRDQLDRKSLEAVRERPETPITSTTKIGDQTYFHAVYADIATSHACVDCHNAHPHSPRKDFQLGDIMGGMIIEFPLGKR
jgi:Protein of unknown function (DUF3365)